MCLIPWHINVQFKQMLFSIELLLSWLEEEDRKVLGVAVVVAMEEGEVMVEDGDQDGLTSNNIDISFKVYATQKFLFCCSLARYICVMNGVRPKNFSIKKLLCFLSLKTCQFQLKMGLFWGENAHISLGKMHL